MPSPRNAALLPKRCRIQRPVAFVLRLTLVVLALLLIPVLPNKAQGPNLLQNPGFENPYIALPDKENCRIAASWVAYWRQGSAEQTSQGYMLAPEYKAAFRDDAPGNRVRSGELSQQYFHSFGNFEAGVYQKVGNITVGSRLRFELWGMTWSCDNESKGNCSNATSGDPSPMHFRIGIDPAGGTDAWSSNIVWSPEQNAYDAWTLFQVEAVAQSTSVTVFVYSYPDYRSQDNNLYLDDASLTVLAPPPTATPLPTNTPTDTPVPTETNTPLPPTETPVPPTATNTPTYTPEPTATAVPTDAPTDTPAPTATATVPPTDTPVPPTATPVPPTATPTPVPFIAQVASGPGLFIGAGLLAAIVVAGALVFSRKRG